MDEESLKLSLEAYELQLNQINEAIDNQSNSDNAQELLQLKEDLEQLVNLTEESLLSLQKSNLLGLVNEEQDLTKNCDGKKANLDNELENFHSDIAESDSKFNDSKKDESVQNDNVDDQMAKFYSELDDPDTTNKPHNIEDKTTFLNPNESHIMDNVPSSSNSPQSSFNIDKEIDVNESSKGKTDFSEEIDPLNEEFLDTIEELEDISGVKCQAPFTTEWSGTQYHNAMIKGPAEKNEAESEEAIILRVLFLNPLMQSMQPCPYYLEGNCKFDEENCRFSHGHISNLYDLRPFIEPDYSVLEGGCECLAKFMDGLWKPAIVQEVKEDHSYSIRFLHKNITVTLELQDILPKISHQKETELATSDSDEDIVTEINSTSSNLYSSYGTSSSSGAPPSLGLWEEHTNGIGSRLLQKMGYEIGQGLGKSGQGRLEPVPIILLPRGKSLDHCMKVKERKGIRNLNDTFSKGEGTDATKKPGSFRRRKRRNCVFSFLNKTLCKETSKATSSGIHAKRPKDMFGIKEGKDRKNTKRYNKAVFHNDEEMKKVQLRVKKLTESIKRNEISNPSVAKAMRSKLTELKSTLDNMKVYGTKIDMHRTRMETHRKMTLF